MVAEILLQLLTLSCLEKISSCLSTFKIYILYSCVWSQSYLGHKMPYTRANQTA